MPRHTPARLFINSVTPFLQLRRCSSQVFNSTNMSVNINFFVLIAIQYWGSTLSNETQIKEAAILLGISSQTDTDKLLLTCTAYGEPPATVEWAMDTVTENWITSNTVQIGELPVTISILEICDANIPMYFQVSCSTVNNVIATSASVLEGYRHVLFNITDGVVHATIGQKVNVGEVSTATNISPRNRSNSVVVIVTVATVGCIMIVAIIVGALLVAYTIYTKTSSINATDLQPHVYNHLQPHVYNHLQHRSAIAAQQPEYLTPSTVPHQRYASENTYATKPLGYSSLHAYRSQHCSEGTDHRYMDLIHKQHHAADEHHAADDDDGMIYCEAYEDGKTGNNEYRNQPQHNRIHQHPHYEDLQTRESKVLYQNVKEDQSKYENTESAV